MTELRYEAPESIEAAVALLGDNAKTAKIFAGGTDLLVQMREQIIDPTLLIDIKKIPETQGITITSDSIRIGASVCGAELGESIELNRTWPGVVEAAGLIGSEQIQGRATLAGNICNASPAADSVPALIAANARTEVAGPNGMNNLPVQDIAVGPGKISLGTGEFIAAIILPKPPPRSGDAYLRFIPRTEMDIAVVGVGVSLSLNDQGYCTSARVVLGAVAPTARIAETASNVLVGDKISKTLLDEAASAARKVCSPIDDKRGTGEFRTKVAGVLTRRAIKIAWKRAEKH